MPKEYMNSQEALIRLRHEFEGRDFLIKAGVSIFVLAFLYFLAQPLFLEKEDYILDFDKVIIIGTFCLGGALKFYFGGKEKNQTL